MEAIANFMSGVTGRNLDDGTVEITIIFCGIGLLVLLLLGTSGDVAHQIGTLNPGREKTLSNGSA